MFAILDCGTTTTRIYLVDKDKNILASVRGKIGVRNTTLTGSKETLRNGITELFYQLLSQSHFSIKAVDFIIASGMITSEIGIIELSHIACPAGINELADNIYRVDANTLLPIDVPLYFVRGVRNQYSQKSISALRDMDFMRGEEVQNIGIYNRFYKKAPFFTVALSSHTKISYINKEGDIIVSATTLSGQLYEALMSATSIRASLIDIPDEKAGGYSFEELCAAAQDCVANAGLCRTLLMPRFMNVLMTSNFRERRLFVDAAIAADDIKAFEELRQKNFVSNTYILYGHEVRCQIYSHMLKKAFGSQLNIVALDGQEEQDRITVDGMMEIALRKINSNIYE